MEKIQTGSFKFITGRDSILIDLSSWYRDSLAPKIETIQDAIGLRKTIRFTYYADKGCEVLTFEECMREKEA